MTENTDPYPTDPMMITPMSQAALMLAAMNPYVNPDTTPPAEALAISARVNAARGAPVAGKAPGEAVAFKAGPALEAPPAEPAVVPEDKLSDEDKHALDVLRRDGIIEQTSENSWRFK